MSQEITSNYDLISSSLASNPPSQLDIFGHDGDPLGMNSAQIGVLEQTHKVRLRSLLQRRHSRALEPKIRLEILSNLPDQPLERQFPDQQLGALLVLSDLPQSNRPRAEAVGLFHTSGGRGGLSCRLRGQLLPGCLSSGRFSCCLLCSRH